MIYLYLSNCLKWSFDKFYHLEYSKYFLHLYQYILNVSANASFSFFRVFQVELESLLGTSNQTLYLYLGVDCSNSVYHNKIYTPVF